MPPEAKTLRRIRTDLTSAKLVSFPNGLPGRQPNLEVSPFGSLQTTQPLKDFTVTDNHSAAQGEPGPEETDGSAGTAIDTTVAHSARVWNYWLGGKDNYKVDRVVAGELAATFPGITDIARQVRLFLFRAIRYLVVEAGVRQFLDIGTGLPTANNTHEIAQGIAPQAR